MDNKLIEINMGEMVVSGQDVKIKTGGIGSCVVITMYDEDKHIGGMAHSM